MSTLSSNSNAGHDFELGAVADSQKRGFWSMFVIMMGFTFFSASMWVGLTLANGDPKINFAGLSFWHFILAVMLGNLILGVYTALLAYPAAKTGLSVHLLSRYSFGTRGSNIPSAILAITQIGWFGVGVAMFAIPATWWLTDVSWLQGTWFVNGVRESFFGAEKALPLRLLWTLTVLSGIVMTSSAYFGIKALHVISVVSVPAIAILGGWSAIQAICVDSPEQIASNNPTILSVAAKEAVQKQGGADAVEAVFCSETLLNAARKVAGTDANALAKIGKVQSNAIESLAALKKGDKEADDKFVASCSDFLNTIPGASTGMVAAIKTKVSLPTGSKVLIHHRPAKGGVGVLIGMIIAISLGIGSFISGGSCTPDFTRFAKDAKTAVSTTVLAFFIGNSLMFFFGGAAAMVYGKMDISNVMFIQGLLLPAVIVLLLNIWTTNDNALYTSGLGLANITGLPKRVLVLFNGLLGTLAALWLYNHFCDWLHVLNSFIPPCGAILITDYFLVNKCKYPKMSEKKFTPVSIPAVAAWAIGSFVALFGLMNLDPKMNLFGLSDGFIKAFDFGLPAINGMVVAAVIYIALSAALRGKRD